MGEPMLRPADRDGLEHTTRRSPVDRSPDGSRVCVGIATRGRPEVLTALVDHLRHQTLRPLSIIIACTTPDDIQGLVPQPDVTVLFEKPGSSRQRNAILQHVADDIDMIAFFDDDFVPDVAWLAAAACLFRDHPRVASITGDVVADGIKGPGLSLERAREVMARADVADRDWIIEDYSPYGCNMAFRWSAVRQRRFDERLVLYGWLEDRDFGGMLAREGWRLLKVGAAHGVHLGLKKGRTAGRRLGYSQVMNPFYLRRKGTMRLAAVLDHVVRNLTANLVGAAKPEPYIDRRGRLHGNAIALLDLCRGRLTPERAEHL